MPDLNDTSYINSVDYKTLENKFKELDDVLEDLNSKSLASRKLRYAEIDIEAAREEGRLQPDELYIPQHIIDTNIRREQSSYIQFETQSPRAVILEDQLDAAVDLSLLEKDLTKKLRYDGWQLPKFANIDGLQANGYGVMEVTMDMNNPGELGHDYVQFGDFAYIMDTRDIQSVEMTSRAYYFTRTRLIDLCGDATQPTEDDFSREQVEKIIEAVPDTTTPQTQTTEANYGKERSLYKIKKIMFRVGGIVNVAWVCPTICDDWVRKPRPLYLGMRKMKPMGRFEQAAFQVKKTVNPTAIPPSLQQYETEYPYILFPYLISENDTISHLKGRVFLDQDTQEAVTSLMSSLVTKTRRSAGLYFSKDVSDPNDDLLLQKNIFFRSGCLINSKVTEFELSAPDASMFSAVQALVASNQNETSQINFAVNNRKDSRKTAEEIRTATSQATLLSTVQVVLYSLASRSLYSKMVTIIKSRVNAGLIKVSPNLIPLYQRSFSVKPSGDVDVMERAQMISTMMNAWPVYQNTPAASAFLADMTELLFPQNAPKYMQAFQQAQVQAQSQQAQQQQQLVGIAQQLGAGIVKLSEHPEYFSETGRIHAFPIVKTAAEQVEQMQQQTKKSQPQQKK